MFLWIEGRLKDNVIVLIKGWWVCKILNFNKNVVKSESEKFCFCMDIFYV